ncbi:MAG: MFS transporter [Candidatus Hydrogenedens sp.]|nr:MFS transporter [Candidatus Hydrogenedentota bacterium]NLF56142.1 MFS transporter [Candidatus Hydrogenedens sp.]
MFSPRNRMCLTGFVIDLAVMIALTVAPFYIYNQLGGDARMSGYFGGLQAVVYSAVCLLSSRWVSKSRNGLTWAYAGITVFTVLFSLIPFTRSIWACGLLGVGAWTGLATVWPALYSWLGADPDPLRRKESLGWFNLSWSAGFAVSPLFAGPLYDYDYRLPFIALAALGALSLALLLSLPHEHAYYGRRGEAAGGEKEEADLESERFLYPAWMAVLMANFMVGVLRSVFPERVKVLVETGALRLFFEETPPALLAGAPATTFSWIAFACSLTTAGLFLVLGHTHRWRHRASWLIVPQLAAAAGFCLLGTTTSLAVMLAVSAVVGANLGVAFFAAVYYCVANPARKHSRAAINEAAVGMGGTLGSFIFGYLAGRYGMALPFLWFPAMMLPALALQLWILRPGRA